jgi:hypothetical protein
MEQVDSPEFVPVLLWQGLVRTSSMAVLLQG